jgi:hypothetical protein
MQSKYIFGFISLWYDGIPMVTATVVVVANILWARWRAARRPKSDA